MASNFLTFSPIAKQTVQFLRPLIIVAGFSVCLTVGLYFFILAPTQARLFEVINAYESVRQRQIHHQATRKTQEGLERVWGQLLEKKEFTRLGVSITQMAKDNKVQIPGMGYDLEKPKEAVASKGALSFEARGAYEAIRRFIYQVETSGPHVFIEKLTAERSKKNDEVAFKITIGTFFKPPQTRLAETADNP